MGQLSETRKIKEDPGKPTRKRDDPEVRLWRKHGTEDVYFQREAQVNFWTVLGGIAVAALLTQMTNLIQEVQRGRWYFLLYFMTSISMIVHSWVQHIWASLVLRVKITMLHTFLLLMDLVCLAILCLQVTNPLIFFAAGGSYIMFAILLIIYLMKSGAMVDLSPERVSGNKTTIWIYLVFMVLSFGAAADLFWAPSVAAEIGWGVFALLAAIAAMVMQHFGMEQERKDLGIP